MLRIFTVVMALVATCLCRPEDSVGLMVDYEKCSWDYGGEGTQVTCSAGNVAVGACGSQTMENCNNGNRSSGLLCCAIKGGH